MNVSPPLRAEWVPMVALEESLLHQAFAEAHHKQALGTLTDKVKTRLDDLMTVCANCHRMLHRMEGKAGDVEKLRGMVDGSRRTRRK